MYFNSLDFLIGCEVLKTLRLNAKTHSGNLGEPFFSHLILNLIDSSIRYFIEKKKKDNLEKDYTVISSCYG